MTEQIKNQFLNMVEKQAEINRLMHGGKDKERNLKDWAMIAGEHLGHLFKAVMDGDKSKTEQELLHVAAPLLELFNSLHTTGEAQ
jgi:hypothetical protein